MLTKTETSGDQAANGADPEDPASPSAPGTLSRQEVRAESEHGQAVFVQPLARSGRAVSRRAEERDSGQSIRNGACASCAQFEPGTTKYQAYLSWLTVGIIYGDIGTSPLYTFSSIYANGLPADVATDVIGALSAMIWTLLILTSVKYLIFVLMADDHGEGGTFAIYALLSRGLRNKIKDDKKFYAVNTGMAILALAGVSMVLADGILTPAISVLGAIAGLEIVSPSAANAVIPVSCVILFLLFLLQYRGTERVSFMFSPIITLWFICLAVIGINNITLYPGVLVAFSPSYAIEYFINNGYNGWVSMGAIFLTVTGSEAMFADLGHFNAKAMRTSAFGIVIPTLLLTYCGQAAAIITNPSVISNAFYLSMPNWALIPMLVIATLAAIIASQAMISASFSIISQAIRLQCFPRMTVKETGKYQLGQVYVPEINYFYMVMVIIVVAGYENATALGYAYGVAVSSVFIITTFFYSCVMYVNWNRHWILVLIFFVFFATIEAAYLSANLLKFPTGGWFTIVLAVIFCCILTTWRWGRLRMVAQQAAMSAPEDTLFKVVQNVSAGDAPIRPFGERSSEASGLNLRVQPRPVSASLVTSQVVTVPSSLIMCYSSTADKIPAAYVHFLRRLPARPTYLVFVTVTAVNVPYVANSDLTFKRIGSYENVYRVVFNYGYAEQPPDACSMAVRIMRLMNRSSSGEVKLATESEMLVEPTFMLGHDTVYPQPGSGYVHRVLVGVFGVLLATARRPAAALKMPPQLVLEVGVPVPI